MLAQFVGQLTGQPEERREPSCRERIETQAAVLVTKCRPMKSLSFPVDFLQNRVTLDRGLSAPSRRTEERLAGQGADPWADPLVCASAADALSFEEPRLSATATGRRGHRPRSRGTAPRLMQVLGYRKSMRRYARVRAPHSSGGYRRRHHHRQHC